MRDLAVTIDNQIAEVKRELAVRERVYRGWIEKGTMREDVADAQMARLRAALHTLLEIAEQRQYSAEMIKLARLRTEGGMP